MAAAPDILAGARFTPDAASTPESGSVDLSGAKFEADPTEKPSLLTRAANAVRWTERAMKQPTNLSAPAIEKFVNQPSGIKDPSEASVEEAIDKRIQHLGYVDTPQGPVKAFDVPGAARLAETLATIPLAGGFLGEAATAGQLAARSGELAAGTWLSNKAAEKTADYLENNFPSQSLHARLLKWMGEQGASILPFMLMPHVIKRFGIGGALHDPGLIPETPETPSEAPEAAKAPEGAEQPEKPTEAMPAPAAGPSEGPLSKLTPKPEQEPELIKPPVEEQPQPIELTPEQQIPEAGFTATRSEEPALRVLEKPNEVRYQLKDSKGNFAGEVALNVTDRANGRGKIQEIWVDPEYRGKSLASAFKQIKDEYPDINTWTGKRVTGANQGTNEYAVSPQQEAKEQAVGEQATELSRFPNAKVVEVPTKEIQTDPGRFQYKLNTNKEGAGVSLNDSKFNPNLQELSLLWRDPEDNKLYVVNGHNRLARAARDEYPSLRSQIMDGGNSDPDAFVHNVSVEDARATGALQNIAGEKGTAVDAAKFFRDQKATPEDIRKIGIDMSAGMTRDALALKKLDSNIFHFVTVGELKPQQGVILGEELGDSPRGQEAAFRWLKGKENAGKPPTNDVLREISRDIKDAGETTEEQGQGGLFGAEFMKRSLFEERATIMAAVKNRLASERAAFANAVRNRGKLEGVGNVLTDENATLAEQAGNRLGVLDAKKTGPINEALNQAANALAQNPRKKNSIIEDAYKAISKAADETLATAPKGEPEPQASLLPGGGKTPAEPGFSLGVSIPGGPQIAAALEPEIRYWAGKYAEGGRGWLNAIRSTFAPQTLGPSAKRAAQIIVEARGEQAAAIVPDEVALAPLRAELERIPEGQWRQRYAEFYDAYEKGQVPANLPPKLRPLMGRIKEAYDQRWRDINALRSQRGRKPMAYLDNYLTHLYADDPAKVRETLNRLGRTSGKPMTQGTPFLNQRKYLDIGSAMRAGLTPRYKNPADMMIAGLMQQDAYIMAEKMFRNLYDAGLIRFFKAGESDPAWGKIPDRFFTVLNYDENAGGIVERGGWQAPKDVVRVLTNHLSPSVATDDASLTGKIASHFGAGSRVARFNAFRVGFSTFHFLNENNAAMAQMQGVGVARALTGLLTMDGTEIRNGLRMFGKANEPVSTVMELFNHGDKIMRALVEPGTQGAEYDRAVQAAVTGGMRFKAEQTATLAETLKRAANEVLHPLARDMAETREMPPISRKVVGGLREFGNLADLSSTALMNHYIPRMKAGAFYKLLGQELDHYTSTMGGQIPWAMQREIMQNVSAHVDSVFGQMVEDNLFMSKTWKDALHLLIAYPGWNIGSMRLLLKAGQGIAKGLTFQSLDSQQRLAVQFAYGLVTSQAIQNAMLQRMLAGTWPQTVQDLFQPQDGSKDALGNPTRLAGPSYMRTYYSLSHHPVAWVQNIINPVWGLIDDTVNNRERFSGRQIWEPGAPLAEQAGQVGEYLARFASPFSLSNYERLGGTDTGPLKKGLAVAGYSPVPAQYLRTQAENHVYELAGEKAPRTGLNEREYAAKQAQNALEDAVRDKKQLDPAHKKMLDSLDPALKEKVEERAAKAAQLPRIVNMMRRMTLHDVLDTWDIARKSGDARNEKYAQIIIRNKAENMDPKNWQAEMEALPESVRVKYQAMLREVLIGKPAEAPRPAAEASPEA